jgi:hypothetical protein
MTDQFAAARDQVWLKYQGWVLGSIERTYAATRDQGANATPLAAFILTSCAIDFFAGFLSGIDSFDPKQVGEKYRDFVKKYMPQYDADDVYKGVRAASPTITQSEMTSR